MRVAIVLVHSPLVGPSTWQLTARALRRLGLSTTIPDLTGVASASSPRVDAAVRAVAATVQPEVPLVLVGHSGAGPLLPVIGGAVAAPVVAYLFVDAGLPPVAGAAQLIPPEFRAHLGTIAHDGVLPPWNEWFEPDAMAMLLPDDDVRRQVEEELPRLPVDYFDEAPEVSPNWSNTPCAYLRLSPQYDDAAMAADQRGSPVERTNGTHLSTVTDPQTTAELLIALLIRLGLELPSTEATGSR